MQIPFRKPGEFTRITSDPHITQKKHDELSDKLKRLKESLPKAIQELQRLAEMGDFSENAAYQMAKGKVRGINDWILNITEQLKAAIIIKPGKNKQEVQLGSRVRVKLNGRENTYQILGSAEIDLSKNVISHNSPLGASLMGKRAGDSFAFQAGGEITGEIIKVE
ncbi:MAG TPA: GreA/GreB family elongation factor [Patescibacteria group bacterium]|nr:GreA/GreB family elongation factor [Patescibacteria group bacterium]